MKSFRPLPELTALLAAVLSLQADDVVLGPSDAEPGEVVEVPLGLEKTNPVVAMQFKLRYPPSHVSVSPPLIDGTSNHLVTGEDDLTGEQTIVVHSPSNSELPADFQLRLQVQLGSNGPVGGPSLSVSEIVLSDAFGNSFPTGVSYDAVEEWRRDHFSEQQRENPELIGDDRDPDGDGRDNLIEAGSGTDPLVADDGGSSDVSIEVDGEGRAWLKMRFRRTKSAALAERVATTGEASVDLSDWSDDEVVETPTGVEDADSVEIEAAVEIPDPDPVGRRFLRVRAKRVP